MRLIMVLLLSLCWSHLYISYMSVSILFSFSLTLLLWRTMTFFVHSHLLQLLCKHMYVRKLLFLLSLFGCLPRLRLFTLFIFLFYCIILLVPGVLHSSFQLVFFFFGFRCLALGKEREINIAQLIQSPVLPNKHPLVPVHGDNTDNT